MSENVLDDFINKKKDESVYVSLQDNESIKVIRLRDIKLFSKPGYNGELKETLRLIVDVDTESGVRTKNFDNSTASFANELKEKRVTLGSSFVLTRRGTLTQTKYHISNVADSNGAAVAPAPTATPAVAAVAAAAPAPVAAAPAPVAPAAAPEAVAPVAPAPTAQPVAPTQVV